MSAIWGIAAQYIDDSLRVIFDQMTVAMSHSDTAKDSALITDQAALGHSTIGVIHNKGFPLCCDDGCSVAVCGLPIWEGDCLENNMVHFADDDRRHEIKILQNALNGGRPSALGGVFAFAKWNPDSEKLTLGTDRLGFKGLYYYYDENRNVLFFASRLRGITQCVPNIGDIDYSAIKEFLNFGHVLGDKTFYSKIQLVPPGTLLEYDSSGIQFKEYWNIGNIRIDHAMTYQDAVERNAAALKKAMARRINRCNALETTLLLSGGADSRRIAGELSCQGVDFKTYTTRGFTEHDSEAAIAAAVADLLNVENNFVELPMQGFVSRFWNRATNITDYECCLHQWLLPLTDKLPEKGGVNYDGLAGDILIEGVFRASGFAEQPAFNKINNQSVTNKAKKIIGEEVQLSFLKPKLRNRLSGISLRDSVVEALQKYSTSENQLTLFYLMNRTRRSISLASTRVLQSKIESLYPFLDIDVLNAALSVPYEHRLKHTLRRDIVEFAYPELNAIPYTQYKSQVDGYSADLQKAFRHEKAFQLRHNIRKFSIEKRSPLSRRVFPKLAVKYFLSYFGCYHPPQELGLTCQVFYDWFIEHDIKRSCFQGKEV